MWFLGSVCCPVQSLADSGFPSCCHELSLCVLSKESINAFGGSVYVLSFILLNLFFSVGYGYSKLYALACCVFIFL